MISLTPPRLEGGSLPGLPRYVTGQLRRLGPVRIVPLGRDVDLLASRHRNRIRDCPRAGKHGCGVREGSRREEGEALALQLLQLDLGRHESRGEHPALGHAACPGRDQRGDRQDPDGEEGQREYDLDQTESGAVVPATLERTLVHGGPHWTVTIPVGLTIESVRT